jgi:hypothetical protein
MRLINAMACHGLQMKLNSGSQSTDYGTQIDYCFSSIGNMKWLYFE